MQHKLNDYKVGAKIRSKQRFKYNDSRFFSVGDIGVIAHISNKETLVHFSNCKDVGFYGTDDFVKNEYWFDFISSKKKIG